MPSKNCESCHKAFYARPALQRLGYAKYCSRDCQYKEARKGKEMNCNICGASVYRSAQQLARSKSGRHFCSKSCQTKWRNSFFRGDRHMLWKNGESTYRDVLMKSARERVCELCYMVDMRVLAVHHINEDKKDFRVDNLAWLCHNCHHLVHHDKVEKQKFASRRKS